jgi:hypothetical protein
MVWRRRSILQLGVIACAMLLALAVGGVGSLAQAQRPLEELPQPLRFKLPPGLARYAYDKSAGDYLKRSSRCCQGELMPSGPSTPSPSTSRGITPSGKPLWSGR